MKRTLFFVIFLTLILGALYTLPKKEKFFSQKNVLGVETNNQSVIKGRIYSDPQNRLFLVDLDGNLYGLDFENNKQGLVEKSSQVKNLKNVIEVVGEIKKDENNYGEKKIEVNEIRNTQEENVDSKDFYTECKNQKGEVETIEVCKFSNGQECVLGDFLKGRCFNE